MPSEKCSEAKNNERYKLALKLNNRGLANYMKVDFDDAISDYSEALALCPDLAVALYNRGTVLYRLGNLESALQDLQRAVQLDPLNSEFLEGLRECQRLMSSMAKKETTN